MKKTKRLAALFLVLAFAFSLMATTALAAESDTAQPYSMICPACDNRMTREVTTTDWGVKSSSPCKHFVYGNDITESRFVTTRWICGTCHFATDANTEEQERDVCYGTNVYPGY